RALTTDAWKNATVHAQNALTLDPTLVEAYSALADLARIDGRWDDARRLYLQGLEIDPRDVTLNLWYSEYLQDVGQLEKALAQNQYVLELDLLSPGANTNLVGGYLALGDCKAMEAPARRAVALGHDFGYFGPILCAVSEQRWKDA
ncbi:MAG: tetratricopeptide repeat protein, partial [Pseudomonadota bacterium]